MDGLLEATKSPTVLGVFAIIGAIGLAFEIRALLMLRRLKAEPEGGQSLPPTVVAMLLIGGLCFTVATAVIALGIQP
ncbi:MAG: hypothetical protein KKE02_13375 [Alphaproteobacteria bacterium]|nr:hypothetical protein [Alphaproteobacteria bacterium]MBU1516970.1 hypothetical protein [Alphaproteobacteria bacterium]MBU2095858.1 hypothetical protein [Alphaproteobacteria bacterium]MBU2152005.1 hypothetical protein [Alphaproteobacteria bacterium]MBU2309526.1 hypothetical protein [Alphaproteobacteria bacterium]